jgi:alpha-amylase
MPIMPSPSYHGYDVADYDKVNPDYGTNDDFKRLMAEAHKRGIRVIIDLVMNHTSSQHPWFIESQDPQSPKRDWYVWSAEKPQGQGWYEGKGAASDKPGYYYAQFWEGMPDLNYRNPDVTAAMDDIIRFWLADMGADGYRLDAIKFLIEEGTQLEHTAATLQWLRDFYKLYKSIKPDAFTVGEVWNDTSVASKYVGDKVDVVFEFDLATAILDTALRGTRNAVASSQPAIIAAYPPGQYATFLANHDQDRTRSRLMNDAQAKLAASLELLFSGVPFIYYGEEIGMQGAKPDENIRRPLQWTAEGGFTTGAAWHEYDKDYPERNIAAQEADPGSLLNHYRGLIRLRAEHEALRVGEWLPVEVTPVQPGVYAFVRHTANEQVLVLLNLGSKPITDYALNLAAGPFAAAAQPALLMGAADALSAPEIDPAGGFTGYRPVATLPPRSTFVLQFRP